MNRENAAAFLPLVQALADGKTIQYFSPIREAWEDAESLAFDSPPESYRIKPEPREWGGKVKGRSWHDNKETAKFSIEIECSKESMPEMGTLFRVREILDDGGAE